MSSQWKQFYQLFKNHAGCLGSLIFVRQVEASPVYCLALSSCSRVLITSIGCRQHASATPPIDPEGTRKRLLKGEYEGRHIH
jgi:hypothetical protein